MQAEKIFIYKTKWKEKIGEEGKETKRNEKNEIEDWIREITSKYDTLIQAKKKQNNRKEKKKLK